MKDSTDILMRMRKGDVYLVNKFDKVKMKGGPGNDLFTMRDYSGREWDVDITKSNICAETLMDGEEITKEEYLKNK